MELTPQEISAHTAYVKRWWIEPNLHPGGLCPTSWISVYENRDGSVCCGCCYPTLRDVAVGEILPGPSDPPLDAGPIPIYRASL